MNRAHWQQLAEERVRDAEILLAGGQWSAAYYLAGYAVECGLKSCVLAYVESHADIVFREKRYSENCWTHDIGKLVDLAALEDIRASDIAADPFLAANWRLVQLWNEGMRYAFKSEAEAIRLFEAVTHNGKGVLPWIRIRW